MCMGYEASPATLCAKHCIARSIALPGRRVSAYEYISARQCMPGHNAGTNDPTSQCSQCVPQLPDLRSSQRISQAPIAKRRHINWSSFFIHITLSLSKLLICRASCSLELRSVTKTQTNVPALIAFPYFLLISKSTTR